MGTAQRPRAADHGVRPLSEASASTPASGPRRVALALDALRHGWPIRVTGGAVLLPAETGFGPGVAAPRMLISAARAVTLKLANQREAAVPEAPVLIRAAEPFDLETARAVADPALDLVHPMKGPFAAEHIDDMEVARTAMELARLAGILPAFLVAPAMDGEVQEVSPADLDAWKDTARLAVASRAHLPVAACEDAEIVAFRSYDDLREHVALGEAVDLGFAKGSVLLGNVRVAGDQAEVERSGPALEPGPEFIELGTGQVWIARQQADDARALVGADRAGVFV